MGFLYFSCFQSTQCLVSVLLICYRRQTVLVVCLAFWHYTKFQKLSKEQRFIWDYSFRGWSSGSWPHSLEHAMRQPSMVGAPGIMKLPNLCPRHKRRGHSRSLSASQDYSQWPKTSNQVLWCHPGNQVFNRQTFGSHIRKRDVYLLLLNEMHWERDSLLYRFKKVSVDSRAGHL